MSELLDEMKEIAEAVNQELDKLLPVPNTPESKLVEAMRYSAISKGKKMRPFLLIKSASLFDVPVSVSLRLAAALEMVHIYSLIHDDLPCMDNDDLRHGQESCHKKFDETTALLAGDALLTRAFDVIADDKTCPDAVIRCRLIMELARAAGAAGMMGGQMLDMMAADLNMDLVEVTRLQQMKTGRLISFACEAGAILGKASFKDQQILKDYAKDIGLAFQITDDLLDVEGTVEEMGKSVRKDVDASKATFVSFVGVDEAKKQADNLIEQAISRLAPFGEKAASLRLLALFITHRRF
jgi:farnesyl diphosphate synthase